MPAHAVWEHRVPQGVTWIPLDRFVGPDEVTITSGEVSEIEIRIFEAEGTLAVYEQLAIDPGDGVTGPIFDTLQTDGRWKPGPPGYNSRFEITPAMMLAQNFTPKAGRTYRLEIRVNSTIDGILWSVHEYAIASMWSVPVP